MYSTNLNIASDYLSFQGTRLIQSPSQFLNLVPTEGSILFIFDKDGTLDDSRQIEQGGRVPKETVGILNRLNSVCTEKLSCTTAIVSGRGIQDLSRLAENIECRLIGLHGCETRRNRAAEIETLVAKPSAMMIETFFNALMRGIAEHKLEGTLVKAIKSSAKAEIFWEHAPEHEETCRHIFSSAFQEVSGLSVIEGSACMEVLSHGAGKGPAVELLIQETNPEFIVCAGNDIPDLAMFQALANSGRPHLNIIVGDYIRFPGAANLRSPTDLGEALELYCLHAESN